MTDIVSNVWVPISRHFRKRRMVEFLHEFSITPATRVLDVGGGRFNWDLVDFRPTLTIVNPYLEPNPLPGVTYVRGDACRLPFADNAFDVVFSNSVIEHVGANRQAEFARECCRVGRRYYIQTPNRRFPIHRRRSEKNGLLDLRNL